MGKLYVGNLSFKSTDDDLKAHFEKVGSVKSAKVIMDRENPGKSRGFGFVEMDESDKAIEKLNDTDMGGRNISVSIAKDTKGEGRSRGNRGYDRDR